MTENPNTNRRQLLQAFASVPLSKGLIDQIGGQDPIGSTHLVEVGVEYKVVDESVPSGTMTRIADDSPPEYAKIERNTVVPYPGRGTVDTKLLNHQNLVNYRDLEPPGVHRYPGSYVSTTLDSTLSPSTALETVEPNPGPDINVTVGSGGSVEIKVADERITVPVGSTREVDLSSQSLNVEMWEVDDDGQVDPGIPEKYRGRPRNFFTESVTFDRSLHVDNLGSVDIKRRPDG